MTLRHPHEHLARALENEIAQHKATELALREAVRVRDEFLLIAGHELKTPLTALQLQMQSLTADLGEQDTQLKTRFGKAARQVERLQVLAEDLLVAARVSAGTLTLDLEEFDMAAALREIVDRHAEAAAQTKTELHLIPGEALSGNWDRLRIELLLTNLLSNALKYGRGGRVQVSAKPLGESVKIVVKDAGIGIAPADHARVFDRFERAASFDHFGGLGLGLWIAKQIVAAHAGTIRVESAMGDGATFFVKLPRNIGVKNHTTP